MHDQMDRMSQNGLFFPHCLLMGVEGMQLVDGSAVLFLVQISQTSWSPVITYRLIWAIDFLELHESMIILVNRVLCFNVWSGNDGTIDGQGKTWWKKYRSGGFLNVTRPYLIELMHSNQIHISNITLINSPSWFVHPVYSRFEHACSFYILSFILMHTRSWSHIFVFLISVI